MSKLNQFCLLMFTILMSIAHTSVWAKNPENSTHSKPEPQRTTRSEVLAQEPSSLDSKTPEGRIENIHIDDGGAQINELRVRGETQSIEVKPQGNLPAYEVVPQSTTQPTNQHNTSGQRRWRILSF